MAARAQFALGRWDDAAVLLDRAAGRVAPELAAARVYIHTARCQLELARGRVEAAAGHLAVAREAYAQTVTQPWFATPLFMATAELALLEGNPGAAGAAVAEGLKVAGADPGFAAPLFVLGLRAATAPTGPSGPAPTLTTGRPPRPAGPGPPWPASCGPGWRPPRATARCRHPAPGPWPCSARPSWPGWRAAATPGRGRPRPRPGSGSASPTRPPTPAGARPRRCCSAACPANGWRRRCGPRTGPRANLARPPCWPRSRAWPGGAASTSATASAAPRRRCRPRRWTT